MSFALVVASYAQLQNLRLQAALSWSRHFSAELFQDEQLFQSAHFSDLSSAQTWLEEKAQALTTDATSPVVWNNVCLPLGRVAATFLLCLFALYALPTAIELLVLPYSSAVVNVLIGDLASYLVLFFLGHKRLAAITYLTSRLIELVLLENGWVRPELMLWLTDALPSLLCAGILCSKIVFLPTTRTEKAAASGLAA